MTPEHNTIISITFKDDPHPYICDLKEHHDSVHQETIDTLAQEALSQTRSYCFAVAEEKLDATHTFIRLYDGITFFQCADWSSPLETRKYITPFRTEVLRYAFYEINPRDPIPLRLDAMETQLMYWKLFECLNFDAKQEYLPFAKKVAQQILQKEDCSHKEIRQANFINLGQLVMKMAKNPNNEKRTTYYASLWEKTYNSGGLS